MSSKSPECSLNTTECILQTVASILSEIQDEKSEYNWDPLSFAATAVIGVIALFFAALTIGQGILAAGPGRVKSGAYAIGPWSRLNDRKFDWVEMRYRTVSRTPVLLAKAVMEPSWADLDLLRHRRDHNLPLSKELVALEDPKKLKKGPHDYFPATWLALLTALDLDETKLWGSKPTGADYVPSDISTVPAYGSIAFAVTLVVIFSKGYCRLGIDRESDLPRVQGQGFNLIFRQHPLLGPAGLFERYDAELSTTTLQGLDEVRSLILYASGYMEVPVDGTDEALNQRAAIEGTYAKELDWNYAYGYLSTGLLKRAKAACACNKQSALPGHRCCGILPSSWPSSCGILRKLLDGRLARFDIAAIGPLYSLIAGPPRFLPLLFPRTKARLREKLDTLFLQSRFWSIRPSAYLELEIDSPAGAASGEVYPAKRATTWAATMANGPVRDLELDPTAWTLAYGYLRGSSSLIDDDHLEQLLPKATLRAEIVKIDAWLKQLGSLVLCRQMTLGLVGHAIKELTLNASPQDSDGTTTIKLDEFMFPDLRAKLECLARAIAEHRDPVALLFKGALPADAAKFYDTKKDLFGLVSKVQELWEIAKVAPVDDDDEERLAWKVTDEDSQHPLDDLLIYRAVLVSFLYSTSIDSTDLNTYALVVPLI